MNTVCRVFLLLVSLSCSLVAQAQQRSASDPWWFEIEAIVFERTVEAEEVQESFPLKITPIDTTKLSSFITDTLYPDFSMLRMGARQCLTEDTQISFPKQTVRGLEVAAQQKTDTQDVDENALPADSFFKSAQWRQQFLDNYNLSVPEYVVANTPSQQWLSQLENLFSDVNQSLADWREDNSATWRLKLFPMTNYQIKDPTPSVRIPDTLYCNWSEETDYFETEFARELKTSLYLSSVPKVINGIEYPFSDKAYSLPADKLAMKKLKRDIQRRRGLNVILHTAWRQNVVVGRDKAPWYRFYAGDNHSKQYQYNGFPVEPEETTVEVLTDQQPDIFAEIQEILEQPTTEEAKPVSQPPAQYLEIAELDIAEGLEEVWTLDGRLKVFIEYIGGTPYLHIDSDLNYRKPVFIDWLSMLSSDDTNTDSAAPLDNQASAIAVVPQDNFLQAYHFDQIRRVISNEIHYFDHPLFGMVFQIRRHRRPDPELPPDYYD